MIKRAEIQEVAAEWLAPIDEMLADLYDKSLRYDARRFAAEIEAAVLRVPALFDRLNIDALASSLEEEIGKGILSELN